MEVYKYLDDRRTKILSDGLIRFTQPKFFNDPFEVKPVIKELGKDPHTVSALNENYEQSLREAYQILPLEAQRLISLADLLKNKLLREKLVPSVLSRMDQQTTYLVDTLQTHLVANLGILSLSEVPDNLLMWAHYANEHKGFVVGFFSENEFFVQKRSEVDQLRHLRKVRYSETRPVLTFSQINDIDDLMVKSADWAYEKEWRVIQALVDADRVAGDVHLFKIPFSAFNSVRIGARASQEMKKEIYSLLERNTELTHVKIYELSINNKDFGLVEEHIK
ncbi:MAG: DUF2971 domain-containing protein [Methylophaga sp.]